VAITTETLRVGGSGEPARPLAVSPTRTARRVRVDRWAARLVILGGVVIIGAILAILLVITAEVYPLFKLPRAESRDVSAAATAGPAPGSSAGVDEYREVAYVLTTKGEVEFVPLAGERRLPAVVVPGLSPASVTSVAHYGRGRLAAGTSDGRVIPLEVKFGVTFEGARVVTPEVVFGDPVVVDAERERPIRRLAIVAPPGGLLTVAQVSPTDLVVQGVVEKKSLIGPSRREETRQSLRVSADGEVTALALDGRGDNLFVGTSRGELLRYDMRDRSSPALAERSGPGGSEVTVLGFLIGDRTLVVGDARGRVSTWQVVPPAVVGAPRLVRMHEFPAHGAAVAAFSASSRDKGFVTADARGSLHVSYGTSGQTLLRLVTPAAPLGAVVFAPKADGLVGVDGNGRLAHWRLDNPHPEVTLHTLFGKVWYEGYPEPDYVWQSTGGTDDFETKLSLTPLVFGTLKGTFYALLIAVPIALLAALYVAEFMHPAMKATVKPVVEIMAALPSVVLGFLAGLWLAPVIERVLPGLFLFPFILVAAILGALLAWRALPMTLRGRFRTGSEALLLVPVAVAAGLLAITLGGFVERWLLAGDYRGWLQAVLGLTYDQRNSLVVGVAMGFAVIPIIFTIAEDSLTNVPQHLRAGSLALGATRWQTALRVVLPTASPGIFSAIMIGFGRAVGETMIVLMATGNTPVMDWSIFSGFRALSANIAVELPEAPEGGTLFRVLFLAALLLFALTFVLNTAAEVVRLRLRRRYRVL
jgi:phosphate transport system permease protein